MSSLRDGCISRNGDDDSDDDCNGEDGNEENQNLRFVGSKTWTGTCDKKGTECTQSDTSR